MKTEEESRNCRRVFKAVVVVAFHLVSGFPRDLLLGLLLQGDVGNPLVLAATLLTVFTDGLKSLLDVHRLTLGALWKNQTTHNQC